MPWDLKYRPRKFSEMLGNKAVINLLHNLSKSGKLGDRSLMFGGAKGCGKTTLARIVACAVVCADLNDGEPCGNCDSCLGVVNEAIDNFEEFDAATHGSVDRMRSIVSDLDYGNLNGKSSVFILDEAQRLTKQAQDALLKSVEDRRMLIILSTTEPHKIQGPLRSRLTEFSISAPSNEDLLEFLRDLCAKENISASDESLGLIMQAHDNCPRTCITSIELLSASGSLSSDDVRSYFRFDSIAKLVRALEDLSSDPRSGLFTITELLNSEGASWVRDNIILIITSAVRVSIGVKPAISVPASLYTTRGPSWISVAKALGSIDRPNCADIEAIILEALPNLPSSVPIINKLPAIPTQDLVPVMNPSPQKLESAISKPIEKPIDTKPNPTPDLPKNQEPIRKIVEPKSKAIEIEGVNFTPVEQLTSVDHKLERGSRGTSSPNGHVNTPGVQFDQAHVPLTPKEFRRGFIQRIKAG